MKIIINILLLSLLMVNINLYAQEWEPKDYYEQKTTKFVIVKNLIINKHWLEKQRNGKKYIRQIDKLLQWISNKKTLNKLEKKLYTLQSKNTNKKIEKIINYFYYKTQITRLNFKDFSLELPVEYIKLMKEEKNIFSAFKVWYFYNDNNIKSNTITKIKFINTNSIKKYIGDTDREEEVVKEFKQQQIAIQNKKDIILKFGWEYKYKDIWGKWFHVWKKECRGDIYGCKLVEYITFDWDIKIEFDAWFSVVSKNSDASNLIESFFYTQNKKNVSWKIN